MLASPQGFGYQLGIQLLPDKNQHGLSGLIRPPHYTAANLYQPLNPLQNQSAAMACGMDNPLAAPQSLLIMSNQAIKHHIEARQVNRRL